MIGVFALVIVAVWMVRAMASSSGDGLAARATSGQRLPGFAARPTNLFRLASWLFWFGAVHDLQLGKEVWSPALLATFALLSAFNLPSLTSAAAVRLLPPGLAWHLVHLLMPRWTWTAPRSGAAILVVRAAAARGSVDPALLARLASRARSDELPSTLIPLGAATLAAAGGDRALARALFEEVAKAPLVTGSWRARRIALDWCVADAWERGDLEGLFRVALLARPPGEARVTRAVRSRLRPCWGALVGEELGRLGPWLETFRPGLERLAACGEALRTSPHPLDQARRAGLEALSRELDAAGFFGKRGPPPLESREPPPSPEGPPLTEAIGLHTALLARPWPMSEELSLVAERWDLARAEGGPGESLASLAVEDLAERLISCARAPRGDGPTLTAARQRARALLEVQIHGALDELTDGGQRFLLSNAELWGRWALLRPRLDLCWALSDLLERDALLPDHFDPLLEFAVWAWNVRREHLLSRVIMLWMLERGAGLTSEDFVEVLRGNCRLPL